MARYSSNWQMKSSLMITCASIRFGTVRHCLQFSHDYHEECSMYSLKYFVHLGADLYDDDAILHTDKNAESNAGLLRSLRHDDNDKALHEIACEDFAKHRMTEPVRASTLDSSKVVLDLLTC
jgi:hypothetical protein